MILLLNSVTVRTGFGKETDFEVGVTRDSVTDVTAPAVRSCAAVAASPAAPVFQGGIKGVQRERLAQRTFDRSSRTVKSTFVLLSQKVTKA